MSNPRTSPSHFLEIWRDTDNRVCVFGFETLRSGGRATLFVRSCADYGDAMSFVIEKLGEGWTIRRDEVGAIAPASFVNEWGRA